LNPKPDVLYSEEQIRARIRAMGTEIASTYAGREIAVIGLMKSCLVFMADVIRAIPADLTCHLLRVSASPSETGAAARTEIVFSTSIPYAGRDILLLDDIVDTGITLHFVLEHIKEKGPRSIKVCALIDKPGERKIDVRPDWSAFTLDGGPSDRFLVGYGLDYAESYRGLPYIGTIPRPAPGGEGRKITLSPAGAS
jgi:hypoxanthine phosphoribosyltransferase